MSIKIMTWVWDNSPYEGARLLLHLAMADHAHDDGRFFASQERLAEKARCSKEYVRLTVQQMVADGMIVVERAGRGKGRATEYRIIRNETEKPNSVGDMETVSETKPNSDGQKPNSDGDKPNSDGQPPNSAWTHPSYTTVLPNRPSLPAAIAAGVVDAELVSPEPETVNQIVARITRTYTDVVKLSNYSAIFGIVKKAYSAGYMERETTDALARLADAGRPVTTDTLRIELDGLAPRATGKPSVVSIFAAADQALANAHTPFDRLEIQP